MQHKVEFLKYEETPDLNFLGIAHIRISGIIVMKYKVVQNKDGTGYFISAPSYKREINGQDKWGQWFMLDSMSFNEEVQDFIREEIGKLKQAVKQQDSVFTGMPEQKGTYITSPQQEVPTQDENLPF